MSTRSAFTIVGAVIGAYFGNPALGAAIGSYVGGVVDPTQVKGPRLTDAQQQTSQDGVPIPLIFGVARIQGNVIASGPLVEHKHKDNGKGSGTETTTYTYTRTYAIGICEGPIAGIRRIWKNGKLVYDGRPFDGTPTLAEVQQRIALANFLNDHHLYYGGEDQTVDGELEAVIGSGKVPAFRGLAYMVSVDEDSTDIAGAIPTYEFEVVAKGNSYVQGEYIVASYIGKLPYGLNPESRSNPLILGGNYEYSPDWGGGDFDWTYPDIGSCLVAIANHFNHDPYVGVPVAMGWGPNGSDNPTGWHSARAMFPWQGGTPMANPPMDQENTASIRLMFTHHAGFSSSVAFSDLGSPFFPCVTWKDGIWASAFTSGGAPSVGVLGSGVMLYTNDGDLIKNSDTFFGVGPFNCQGGEGGASIGQYYHFGDYRVAVRAKLDCNQIIDPSWLPVPGTIGTYVDRYGQYHSSRDCTVVTGNFRQLAKLVYADNGTSYSQLPVGPVVQIGSVNDNEQFWRDAYEIAVDMEEMPSGLVYGTDYPVATTQACYCATSVVVQEGDVSLAEIVSALCIRAGLSIAEINVTELTDRVIGFTVATQTNAADTINVLAPGFFFDGAEWDGITHFVKRGHNHVEALSINDAVDGDGPRVEETRAQDVELPRKMILSYFDPAANFAVATQSASRVAETVNATGTDSLQIAVAMSSTQAAQVADVLLKDQWSALQGTIKQTVADRYSYLTPTDVIHLESDGVTFRLRLGQMTTEDGTLAYESTQDVQSAYTSRVEGITPPTPDDGVALPVSPTLAVVANLPALRDQDDQTGVYIFASGVTSKWSGALVEVSRDGGITWQSGVTILQSASIGQLTEPLAAWNPYVVEDEESFTVRMTSGELSSITDAQLFQQMNGAIVGQEIIQFRSAVLVDAGEYRLEGLVRGRKNTQVLAHDVDENFALLEDAYFLPLNRSDIGKTITIRAVTLGTANSDAPTQSFVFSPPKSVTEWPVTNVRADRTGSGIQFNWSPRARMGNAESPYQSVYFNGYQLAFTSGSTTKIYTSSNNTFTYTEAMQIADFGSAPVSLTYSISATNSLIGPGESYTGTV